jgi:hypothetical protein
MMRSIRQVAVALLGSLCRRLAPGDREWGQAMLRELDVIDRDREALLWILGSVVVLCRRVARHEVRRLLTTMRANTGGIAAGIAIVGVVFVVSGAGLLRVVLYAIPAWRADYGLAQWLTAIVMPELVFVVTAAALWRRRRSVATGVVLAAVVLIVHFVVHVAAHGHAGALPAQPPSSRSS